MSNMIHPHPKPPYSSPPTSHTTTASRSSPPDTTSGVGTSSGVFGIPMKVSFTATHEDSEKALPGPGPNTSRHRRIASLANLAASASTSRRKRRFIGQIVGLLTLVSIGGVWWGGLPGKDGLSTWVAGRKGPDVSSDKDLLPGVIIGEHGTYLATAPPAIETTPVVAEQPNRPKVAAPAPTTPIQLWGLDLSADRMSAGLREWPENPPHDPEQPPLSTLGHFADNVYNFGPLTLSEYSEQLHEFAKVAFPEGLSRRLEEGLDMYLGEAGSTGGNSWDGNKMVWQTDKDKKLVDSNEVKSWKDGSAKDEKWKWSLMTDAQADKYVKKMLKGSRLEMLWENLPTGILRSDTLRYLLLLLEGGIYSDTDTILVRAPSLWGKGSKLFRDGAGWLDDERLQRIQAGEKVDDVLGPPSVVVGVEADVGGREDWFDWWPRPMQIVQWTMASAPDHPIALSALLRILHATSQAIDWAHEHATEVKQLNEQGRYDDSAKLLEKTVLSEPKEGGPLGVMGWTGPGIWTDAVLSYLRARYGVLWTDLRGIRVPLRIGDVVILPVTGFSPGVGNFGSQPTWDKEAMVEHRFRGSWKPEEEKRFYMGAKP